MFGFINLNKPQGLTSHDCVGKIRRLINIKKVGHGGTLDPKATGVLPIAVGKATRLLQFLPEKKAYRARIRLGVQTTTDDLEGDVIANKSADHLNLEEITHCLNSFQGEIEQIPPIYSAIKQKGIEVEVPKRKIVIYSCESLNIVRGEFTEIEVDINCSAGTYIRAIARDLGAMLGVGGTLANLIRTESCSLKLSDSLDFVTIETQLQKQNFQLIPPDLLLTHLPKIILNSEVSQKWVYGQTIELSNYNCLEDFTCLDKIIYCRIYRQNDLFLGISILKNQNNILFAKPKIVCANFE